MVCRKKEKIFTLALAVTIICLSFLDFDWERVGVSINSGWIQRLSYSFIHASLLHAALNAWCLLCIVFVYDVKWWHIIVAYIIATLVPPFALSAMPTVGLSAVCFALLGLINPQVLRKLYYNAHMALYLAIGFLFPLINGWIHLYSYVVGFFVGFAIHYLCRRK